MLKYIKYFISGTFLGMANGMVEDYSDFKKAKKYASWSVPFLDEGFPKVGYYLVLAKADYGLGNSLEAKCNYDMANSELEQHPECKEYSEFKDTLSKFKVIYGY